MVQPESFVFHHISYYAAQRFADFTANEVWVISSAQWSLSCTYPSYIYIYIYIERERDGGERERERERMTLINGGNEKENVLQSKFWEWILRQGRKMRHCFLLKKYNILNNQSLFRTTLQ